MYPIKQVILIRRDLKMRRGKEIAQGSHASGEFLVHQVRHQINQSLSGEPSGAISIELSQDERDWISRGMAKVCLQVNSEEELVAFHKKAIESGLKSYLIRDSGRTEFHGEPTLTACAIGPASAEKIDAVTGSLSLY